MTSSSVAAEMPQRWKTAKAAKIAQTSNAKERASTRGKRPLLTGDVAVIAGCRNRILGGIWIWKLVCTSSGQAAYVIQGVAFHPAAIRI
mmetsp:Transcript_37712/g.107201  ORF Transcript_37712/g.107201 Transcript_37712/m.107201 type:complete len:89 (-) Transcript_37712:20-286(-)